MSSGASPTFLPAPEALRAASRLERHVEWHRGFWLAYVFTISPPQAHILQERVEAKLRAEGKEQRILRPDTPEALEVVLEDVLAEPHTGCTWVEAVRDDSSARSEGKRWADAWAHFVLRTNERRELLREGLSGGLVLVAPSSLKTTIRSAGPDLWSIRSFAFELPPGLRMDGVEGPMTREADARAVPSYSDAELLDDDLARLPQVLEGREERSRARIEETIALRLQAAGRFERAIELWRDVIGVLRSLPRAQSDTIDPSLARALNNLGACLNALGAREQALPLAQEAVDAYRRLSGRDDGFLLGLARSLDNLSDCLNSLGMRPQALQAAQESIDAHRALARRSSAFLPDLARSLNNLGIRSSNLGRREEALRATQEAVDIRRGLAEQRPDAFLPDLAGALSNLGADLDSLGRREEALRATQEAVDIRRELAEQRPDAFLPDLASALGARGSVLMNTGLHLQALDSFSEGLRIILPAATRLPQSFGTLALALANGARQALREGALPIPAELEALLAQLPTSDVGE